MKNIAKKWIVEIILLACFIGIVLWNKLNISVPDRVSVSELKEEKVEIKEVLIYSKDYCGYCLQAKQFFASRKVDFREIDLTHDMVAFDSLQKRTGYRTVPQIFINEEFIGGYDDLVAKFRAGKLKHFGL